MGMIKTEELVKIYPAGDTSIMVLNSVSLEIQKGEFVAIMGPQGSGKTTLLSVLGLLEQPSGGTYYFDREDVSNYSENERNRLRKGKIGYVTRNFDLIDDLNVYENVEMPLLYLHMPARERRKSVMHALEMYDLEHKRHCFPSQLSCIQRQKVSIARAMISNPSLIIADEPLAHLDSGGEEVMRLLSGINDGGTTIIMAAQSAYEANYAHRILRLFAGKIVTENIRELFDL
jgi:putative ABC transport system ATP-binding protein